MMATTRCRKPPLIDAIEHAAQASDKTAKLEVKFINAFKGMYSFPLPDFFMTLLYSYEDLPLIISMCLISVNMTH